MNKLEKLYKRYTHRFIVKYLSSCGRAFHNGEYGPNGRYVVLMDEKQYHDYQRKVGF